MIWLPAISLSASHARLPKTALCLQLFPATAAVPRRSLACSRRARAAHRPGASSRARRRRAAARRRRLARERSPTDHLGYTVTVSLSIGVVPPGAVPGGLLLPPFWAGRPATSGPTRDHGGPARPGTMEGRARTIAGPADTSPASATALTQDQYRRQVRAWYVWHRPSHAMVRQGGGGGVVMAPVLRRRRSPAAASQATPPAQSPLRGTIPVAVGPGRAAVPASHARDERCCSGIPDSELTRIRQATLA